MSQPITIRRGYDIKLKGAAVKSITPLPVSSVISIKPSDYPKVTPKLLVSPAERIEAGQCLFIDKHRPDLRFTSPVSGEIAEIGIGDKRRILEIRILPDKNNTRYIAFPKGDPSTLSRAALIERLIESGCWNYIRQRPYCLIANQEDTPKAIFISCFDTSPLAPDLSYIIDQEKENFATGIRALQLLSDGNLHIGLKAETTDPLINSLFAGIEQKHRHYFKGPHPAGNVGIQIHHIDPIQKGEVVWYVHPQDVMIIGRLFNEGHYRADRIIALTGSCIKQPRYVQVITGQYLHSIIGEEANLDDTRIIQGNVLHGYTSSAEDFLSFYTNQITLIPEGKTPEFLGWLLPGLKKLSLSRTYFSWLNPKKTYSLNTNSHGEERAFVMTGQYDKVLPMNIYPVFLLKAILAKDVEKMEALGIYEVSEEDFALCEFVCTSKIKVQQIISEGLDLIREEG
jgi:Na+-transporting NADH:ubiquinone oxidoreductase subunit A